MKRFFVLMVLFLGIVSFAYAVPPVGITNSDGSETAAVKDGALSTTLKTAHVQKVTAETVILAIPCWVQSVNIYSDTSGDKVGVYNQASGAANTTYLEFEVGIASNTSSQSFDAKGAYFDKGLTVSPSDEMNSVLTVTYDY